MPERQYNAQSSCSTELRKECYILFIFQVWCMISDTLVKLISMARMITVDAASVVPLSGIG